MGKIRKAGDEVWLRIPSPDPEEEQALLKIIWPADEEIDKFQRDRLVPKRHGRMKIDYDLDLKFINDRLIDFRNVEIKENGSWIPLDKETYPNWKVMIPAGWKRSISLRFLNAEAEEVVSENF